MRRTSPSAVSAAGRRADRLVTGLARGGGDYELGVFRKQNEEMAGVNECPPAFDHQFEHAAQVCLAADRARDGDGRLESAHGALELSATGIDVLVQMGVLDGDRHPAREDK